MLSSGFSNCIVNVVHNVDLWCELQYFHANMRLQPAIIINLDYSLTHRLLLLQQTV